MSMVRTVLRELLGLFVDDGSLALAILLWLLLLWFALRRMHLPVGGGTGGGAWGGAGGGIILFVGLAAILVESVLRFSRKAKW